MVARDGTLEREIEELDARNDELEYSLRNVFSESVIGSSVKYRPVVVCIECSYGNAGPSAGKWW